MRRLVPALCLALLTVVTVAGPASAASTVFNIKLEAEAAAPEAKGHAKITVLPDDGLVCYSIKWKGVPGPVVGGHIHRPDGGIEVSLFGAPFGTATAYPGDKFRTSGCVVATEVSINAILAVPGDFYVNLHIDPMLTSVLRGQLR